MFPISLERLNELEKQFKTYERTARRTNMWPYKPLEIEVIEWLLIKAGRLQELAAQGNRESGAV